LTGATSRAAHGGVGSGAGTEGERFELSRHPVRDDLMRMATAHESKENAMPTPRYFLCSDVVQAALDRAHLTHGLFADHLGLSRSYWSQVFHRHRHLTPNLRRLLLGSRHLRGLAEDALWEIETEVSAGDAP
jgi:antitoxin component HigA of HigAB toxin-antitoxin module